MGKVKPGRMGASDRITLRVQPSINERADALVPLVAKEAAAHGFTRVTRAIVLKRALLEGLSLLEKQFKA